MNPVLIIDGGLATGLEERGHRLHPQLWSAGVFLSDPCAVEDLHLAYLDAGADVIVSASYQMSFEGLARAGLSRAEAESALLRTVEVARHAVQRAGREALVAASVGPYGATCADGSEYRGSCGLSLRELIRFHHPRLAVLASAGADLLAIETIPSLAETRALCTVLGECREARAWLSFCCRDETHLCDGQEVVAAARLADGCPQVVALGVNCTHPDFASGLIDRIGSVTDKPRVVYPNSGESWDGVGRRWSGRFSPERFGDLAEIWAEKGAWAVGGCCGIGPTVIELLARRLGARR